MKKAPGKVYQGVKIPMTKYEKFIQEQRKDPEFAKVYYEARSERIVGEF